jgi:tetratricopeptide (TPR) repeat protein
MSGHLERARVLMAQSRWELAEESLRLELASSPEAAFPHALLALCLSEQEKNKEALAEAEAAVHREPDGAFYHYVHGHVLRDMKRLDEALAAAGEAIRLDPESADFFALESSILLGKRRWERALKSAQHGLELDAEHVGCANLQALALRQLGRKSEAGAAIDTALARDPENALSHANQGWTLLDRGDTKKALEHFREALRIDPDFAWAREGIVTALRARYPIYGWILRYYLWMSKLRSGVQWGLIIGAFVASRVIRSVARTNPELGPILWPLFGLYIAFCLLTWIADPLFNLLLRLNRFGRLALTREEIVASNWVGGLLLMAVGSLLCWAVQGGEHWLAATLVSVAMVLPVAGTFASERGRVRTALTLYTLLLGAAAVTGFVLLLLGSSAGNTVLVLFFLGWFVFQWVALGAHSRQ